MNYQYQPQSLLPDFQPRMFEGQQFENQKLLLNLPEEISIKIQQLYYAHLHIPLRMLGTKDTILRETLAMFYLQTLPCVFHQSRAW